MKRLFSVISAFALFGCSDQSAEVQKSIELVNPAVSAPPIRGLLKCALRTRSLDRPTAPSMDIGNRVFIDLDTTGFTKVSKVYTGSEPDPDRYKIAWKEENASPQVYRTDSLYDVYIYDGGSTIKSVKKSTRYDGKIFCFGKSDSDKKVGSYSTADRNSSWMNYARPFGKLQNACFSGIDLQSREYFSTNIWFVDEGDCQEF